MGLYTMPGLKKRATGLNKSIAEAHLTKLSQASGPFDIFLSQRRLDAEIVQVLYDDITSMGYKVYVDWIHDAGIDRSNVNREAAALLRRRLRECSCLLYVATSSAPDSKWMPWELGFKDGQAQKVAILPIAATDVSSSSYSGMEYLGLYPYVAKDMDNRLPARPRLWIHDDANAFVALDEWLTTGKQPYRRL